MTDRTLQPSQNGAGAKVSSELTIGRGLFGMSALQRLAMSASAMALLAIAAWWALA